MYQGELCLSNHLVVDTKKGVYLHTSRCVEYVHHFRSAFSVFGQGRERSQKTCNSVLEAGFVALGRLLEHVSARRHDRGLP